MRRALRWLPVWLALVIGAALPGVATATFSGQNGMIAFARDGDIWVVNPDGTKLRQVTTDPRWDTNPAWSPDGKTIAFTRSQRTRPEGPQTDVWTIRPDGTGRRQLTSAIGVEREPAWDPTGRRIVYTYIDFPPFVSEMRTISPSGMGDRKLIEVLPPDEAVFRSPDWGPGGQRIVFDLGFHCGAMHTVRADGTNLRTIYSPECPIRSSSGTGGQSWSPDGTRVSFSELVTRTDFSQTSRLATISPTGGGLRYIAEGPAGFVVDTSWSPNGARIAFSSLRSGQWGVYTITPDGTDERLVVQNAQEPAWQPRRAGSPTL